MIIFVYSFAALLTGFVLDAILGDPHSFPHIVRLIGSLTAAMEKSLRRVFPKSTNGERAGGILLVLIVALICTAVPFAALYFGYRLHQLLGYAIESFLCYQLLSAKSLKTESMRVYKSLSVNDTEGARKNVSMIVGRDTSTLDKDGIIRATVETVAENTSDGVVAPLLYMMLGGAALGCFYKAVNTMDSMVGYKNDRYINFGRAAAKTDDVLNYIPSRVCALLMITASYLLRLDGKNAYRIWRRDRLQHASPNSAQTEAVCAGALDLRLAGPTSYFGALHDKPYIGDDTRPIAADDIVIANRLMTTTAVLALMLAILFRTICLGVIFFGTI